MQRKTRFSVTKPSYRPLHTKFPNRFPPLIGTSCTDEYFYVSNRNALASGTSSRWCLGEQWRRINQIRFRRDCRHGKNRAVSILDQMYKLAAALDTSFRRSTFANFRSWTNEFVYTNFVPRPSIYGEAFSDHRSQWNSDLVAISLENETRQESRE